MPGRQQRDANLYRYAYQGQEKDDETGKEAFELRLWDGRLGRWLTTDPYGEFSSPYLGMGNNPVNLIDPDGGCVSCIFSLGRTLASDSFQNFAYAASIDALGGLNLGGVLDGVVVTPDLSLGGIGFKEGPAITELSGFAHTMAEMQENLPGVFGQRTSSNGLFLIDDNGIATHMAPQTGTGAMGLIGGGPSSYKLGQNLIKSGVTRPANSAAHHIVAGTDRRARLARKLLAAEKIGINSAKNGVFLPKSSNYVKVKDAIPHSRIHTNLYYRELTKKLQNAGPGNVGKALEEFKQSILNGTVKY